MGILIWKIDFENSNEESKGYWVCSVCGAIYRQPENWKPLANYCMKCKTKWTQEKIQKESLK